MQKFGKTLITNAGRQMLTDVDGAKGRLTYTKACLYTQDVKTSKEADIIAETGLTGPQLETDLQVTDVKDNTVTVLASFNNAKVTQDLTFNSIGWFAKTSVDDKEQLMAITPSEAEQTLVAGSNGASTSSIDVEMVFARSHDTTVVLSPSSVGQVSSAQMEGAIKKAKDSIESDFQKALKKLHTLDNPILASYDTNPDALCDPGIYYSENGFNFGEKAPDDYVIGKSYLIVMLNDNSDASSGYYQQFLFQGNKETYNIWVRQILKNATDSCSASDFQNLKDIYGKLKQIRVNNGEPISPDSDGIANIDIPKQDLSKYVKSIAGFTPDDNGDINFVRKIYKKEMVDFDQLIDEGIYQLIDVYMKNQYVSQLRLTGFLIVTKAATSYSGNGVYQFLTIEDNNYNIINYYRKVDLAIGLHSSFNRILDDYDFTNINNRFSLLERKNKEMRINGKMPDGDGNYVLPNFENPDFKYTKNQNIDVDYVISPTINHLTDTIVSSSINPKALENVPKNSDGTVTGFLVVNRHDEYNINQILIIDTGVITPDLVFATRSISTVNQNYRPSFRRILNSDDYSNLLTMIDLVDKKELVHFCDDLESGVAYSKANPNVFVATP